ncbi:hypothetical protein Ahy_B01g055129 isoform C [Arachis hypogaea]|uniref:Uncharacterized protein n=1 Tax=Arachis hypogaea TaxID=3818 RepID=A0A445AV64_ARAHY|nr:hypothetical protein Ahy_B01g055129 isoform C [Arachis hypogaea]
MGNTGVSQSCGVSGIELESCEFSIRGGKLLAYSGNWYQVREIGLERKSFQGKPLLSQIREKC